jgi:hypothetical protein
MGMIAAVLVAVAMRRTIGVHMFMTVIVGVFLGVKIITFNPDFAATASACGAHMHLLLVWFRAYATQATSSSLTRISVPPVTCT